MTLALALAGLAGAARAGSADSGEVGPGTGGKGREALTVAVAASMRFAMEEIAPVFERESGIRVQAIFGASGALAAQIRNGAPFDLFLSADMEFPDSLYGWGFAAEKPRPYAFGKLVLWTLKDVDPGKGMAALADAGTGRIALADPERAPYGREAAKALKRSGLYGAVEGRLVYGESISQVTQYVLTGNAGMAFTALSVVRAPELRGKGRWAEVDSAWYDPIAQGAVVCRFGARKHGEAARRFLAFLHGEAARGILGNYGYGLP